MADELRKEVIVDVRLEKQDTEQQLSTITKRIAELKADTEKLIATNQKLAKFEKENTAAYRDNTKGIEINKQLLKELNAEQKSLIQTLLVEDNSIKALTIRNKELIKQRNEISLATAEGRAQIALINKEIDENNKIIRSNVSALEDQKINIGNYASALDAVIPGMSAYVKGTEAMIVKSRAFIATPVGAVIAALGLALGALIAYFKGTEEGQERWNKIVQVGSALLAKFMNLVRDVGEALYNAAENPKQAFNDLVEFIQNNLVNRFTSLAVIIEGIAELDFKKVINGTIQLTTGIKDAVGQAEALYDELAATAQLAIEQGSEVARLQAELRRKEREAKKEEARITLEVARLKDEATQAEGEQKRKLIEDAIALEHKLADEEVELAKLRLKLAEAEYAISDAKIEDTDALIAAQVAVTEAETKRYTTTIRLRKQLHTAIEEERRQRIERYDNDLKTRHDALEEELRQREEALKIEERIIKNFNKRIEKETKERLKREAEAKKKHDKEVQQAREALEDEANKALGRLFDLRYSLSSTQLNKELTLVQNTERDKLAEIERRVRRGLISEEQGEKEKEKILRESDEQQAELKKKAFERNKKLQMAETLISTFQAAVESYKALAGIKFVGPVLGAIAAGLAIAYGYSRIREIQNQTPGYAEGGKITGTKVMPHHGIPIRRSNGDNRLVTVKTGEVVLNEKQQRALGGARTFQRIGVPGFADGGIIGTRLTSQADRQARQSADLRDIAAAFDSVKIVLPIQDFELEQARKNSPIIKAQVL